MIAFRCPSCKNVQRVDESAGGTQLACAHCQQLLAVPKSTTKTVAIQRTAPLKIQTEQPAAKKEDRPWHCTLDGERNGPMSERDIYRLIDRDELRRTDLVWREGWPEWKPAEGYFEFPKKRSRRQRDHDRPARSHSNDTTSTVCGILSIISGVIAILFCPPLFGTAGIVLGAISMSTGESKTIGIIGLVVSILGLVVGAVLGVIVMMAIGQN